MILLRKSEGDMRLNRLIYGLAILTCLSFFGASAKAQGGELVRAEWGVPGQRVDVTSRVRTFIHDGVLQLEVTRFSLGIDPAPHQNKDLIIRVRRWDGQVEEYKYPERSNCSLELDPQNQWDQPGPRDRRDRDDDHHDWDDHHDGYREHRERGLRILRAYYGANGQFVNVTDAVRSNVNEGHISMRVDNYALGVDPAPGVHKWLRVLYVYDGDRRSVTVDEKTFLQLP